MQPRETGVRTTFTLYPIPVEVSYDDGRIDKEKDEIYLRGDRKNTALITPRRDIIVLRLSPFSRESSLYISYPVILALTFLRYNRLV
jgi:hypothetical protein